MPDTTPTAPAAAPPQAVPPAPVNPPGSAAFLVEFSKILEQTTNDFLNSMQAQTQAAIANIKAAEQSGPSDIEIMLAIQQNPELRKAVVTLMQAKKP